MSTRRETIERLRERRRGRHCERHSERASGDRGSEEVSGKAGDKKPVGGIKGTLEVLSSVIAVFTKLQLFVGFLALAFYLGAANHVVSGASLTDAFLLAALALAIGFMGLLLTIFGGMLAFPYLHLFISTISAGKVAEEKRDEVLRTFGLMLSGLAVFVIAVPGVGWLVGHSDQIWLLWAWLGLILAMASAVIGAWMKCRTAQMAARGRTWDRADRLVEALFILGALLMSAFYSTLALLRMPGSAVAVMTTLGAVFVVGVLLQSAKGDNVTPGWEKVGRILMLVALIASGPLAFWLPIFNGERGISKAFQAVSLNVPHATIQVSPSNLVRLERVSAQQGLPLALCRHADGGATLTDVRVLWHALGSTGLVELWPESSDPAQATQAGSVRFTSSLYEQWFNILGRRGVRVPLENSGLTVITGSNLLCAEIDGLSFDSNSATLSKTAHEDLANQLKSLRRGVVQRAEEQASAFTVSRVEIVGHADPRKRVKGTNEELALQRAEAVRSAVMAWVKVHAPDWKPDIKVRSEGAREQARKCDADDSQESAACHAFNRRVVIQMVTSPVTP